MVWHNNIDLHSNMVRFIITTLPSSFSVHTGFTFQYGQIYYANDSYRAGLERIIYIPIWLDLLCIYLVYIYILKKNLHSNMVRFIIKQHRLCITFLYFIYIPIWLDLLSSIKITQAIQIHYLHSNMVRFIILFSRSMTATILSFTFQYGQIYYVDDTINKSQFIVIYIPIWLDLLCIFYTIGYVDKKIFTFQYGQIYYLSELEDIFNNFSNLHSNMVRFII